MSHAYLVEGDTEIAAHWYPFAVNQLAILKRLGIKTRTMTPVDGVLILIGTKPEKIFISVGLLSGFLFKHRWTPADESADPTHIAGELSGRKDLLVTDKNGFHGIRHNVTYFAGRSYWHDGAGNFISWNTYLHDVPAYNDDSASYNLIGKYPHTDDEVYINGSSIGNRLRPFPDGERLGGVYYAKASNYLLAIQYGARTSTQFFPQGIFSAYIVVYTRDYSGVTKTFIDNLSFKKIHINAASTKMAAIVKVLPATAPVPIGTDITTTMTVGGSGEVQYTIYPPFSYPQTGNGIFVNYWEAVIEWDIVQTGNTADPIHLVETSRTYQYAIAAGMKRAAGLSLGDPAYYTLIDSYVSGDIVTDLWFDLDTQLLVKETVSGIAVTGWGTYEFTINNPNLPAPLVQTVDCTGTTKTAHGYSIMHNNPYVKNAVVTVCDVTGSIVESPPSRSGTLSASRYDALGKITFDAITDKSYTQGYVSGWLFPFMYSWHGINYDTSTGISEYSFPYPTTFEKEYTFTFPITAGVWQQIAPQLHFERQKSTLTPYEHQDSSGVLSDRWRNVLYFYGEDDYVLRCDYSPNQRFKAFKKGFIEESVAEIAIIATGIKYAEDIIGVI